MYDKIKMEPGYTAKITIEFLDHVYTDDVIIKQFRDYDQYELNKLIDRINDLIRLNQIDVRFLRVAVYKDDGEICKKITIIKKSC